MAIIRVGKGSKAGKTVHGFSAVALGNSDNIKAGQIVYAPGSPKGLLNTISNGIISNTHQVVGEENFIQITAAISHGSSGGALVNEYGEVLGITSAGVEGARNIGFAIPINIISAFDLTKEGVSYAEFAEAGNQSTIVLSDEDIELSVGETKEILVYADGKGEDWSIYWDTKEKNIVSCDWGDWLEDYESICYLKITGLKVGIAKVTISSDVDFKGVDITVHVKKPKYELYPSLCTKVPTYTSITGIKCTESERVESFSVYTYNYYGIDDVQRYVDYLLDNGFELYDKEILKDEARYYYATPDNNLIGIMIDYKWEEVYLYIPYSK